MSVEMERTNESKLPVWFASDAISALVVSYRYRRRLLKAQIRLRNQVRGTVKTMRGMEIKSELPLPADIRKALTGGERMELFPLLVAEAYLRRHTRKAERAMERLAMALPVWSWAQSVRGLGPRNLACIIGEAGDLWIYSTVAKLWKRFGLAPGQRKHRDIAAALEAGYSPSRRAVMHIVGSLGLMTKQGPYRDLYLARKELEVLKAVTAGLKVAPAAKIPKGEHASYMSEGHIHLRALRVMEKRLLRDLWRAWRGQLTLDDQISAASPSSAAPAVFSRAYQQEIA